MYIQSIIRIVFSREKYLYLKDLEKNKYERFFLKNVISKCCNLTKENSGDDNYSGLFRKDEVYDDIIKYIFFLFGSKVFLKSYCKYYLFLN